MTKIFKLGASVALAVAATAFAAPPVLADTYTPAQAAEMIRSEELNSFTPPAAHASVTIGTLDGATGEFTGKKTQPACEWDPYYKEYICDGDGPPPHVTSSGVYTGLVFKWKNANGPVTIKANGTTYTSTATVGSKTIEIARKSGPIDWAMQVGNRYYADTIVVDKTRIVGAGVFTIKALPIGIAYEPPQDPNKHNKTVYYRETSTATTLSQSFETVNGKTVPQETTRQQFSTIAENLGNALAQSSDTRLKAAGEALKRIKSIIGSTQTDITDSITQSSSATQSFAYKIGRGCTTSSHIGPGGGDKIVYLKNARVVWLDNGSATTLTLLGADPLSTNCVSVQALKDGTSVFDAETAQALLTADPLASGGPNMVLPSTRYTKVGEVDLDPTTTNSPDTVRYTESQWSSYGSATTTAKVTTETMQAGYLAFLGVGPEQDQTVRTSVSSSNSRVTTTGVETTVEATLSTLRTGYSSTLNAYYDKAFGTLVFQAANP